MQTVPSDPEATLARPLLDTHKDVEQTYTPEFIRLLKRSKRFLFQRTWQRAVDEGVDLDAELLVSREDGKHEMSNVLLHFQLKVAHRTARGSYARDLKPTTVAYLAAPTTMSCVIGYDRDSGRFIGSRIDEILKHLKERDLRWDRRTSVRVPLLHRITVKWLRDLADHVEGTQLALGALWRAQQTTFSTGAREQAAQRVVQLVAPVRGLLSKPLRRLHRRATALLRNNDLDTAEALLRDIIADAESMPGTYDRLWSTKNNLALILDRKDQPEGALRLLHEVMTADGFNSDRAMNAAGIHFVRREFDQAKSCLAAAKRRGGRGTAGVLNVEGLLLQNAKRYKTALHRFKAALKQTPRRAEVWMNVGWTHHLLGDDETAIAELRKGIAKCPSSTFRWRLQYMVLEIRMEQCCKELGGEVIYKDDGLVEMSFAEGLSTPRIPDAAVHLMSELDATRRLAPKGTDLDLTFLMTCSFTGEYERGLRAAAEVLKRALTRDKRRLALQSQTRMLMKSSKFKRALKSIDQSTRVGADLCYAKTLKAECLRALGDVNGSFAAIGSLAESSASTAETLRNVVGLAALTGCVDQALGILDRVPIGASGLLDARRAMVLVCQRRGTSQHEVRCLTAYLELEPSDVTARASLAGRLLEGNRLAEACTEFANVPLGTLSFPNLLNWGYALGKLGRWESMIEVLKHAHAIAPTTADRTVCAVHLRSAQRRQIAPLRTARGVYLPGSDAIVVPV